MEFREFVALAGLLLVAAVVAPLRAARHWRGGWRAAALLPLGGLAFVVIRAALPLHDDPLSRRLFPFDLMLVSLGAIMLTSLLRLLHAIARAGQPD